MTKLYHKDICFPSDYKRHTDTIINKPYILSRHILERLNKADSKHNITLNELNRAIFKIKFNCPKPFEIEMVDGVITKCVVRIKYDKLQDISVVFQDKGDHVKINTIWLNKCDDKHKTLDMTKYESEI